MHNGHDRGPAIAARPAIDVDALAAIASQQLDETIERLARQAGCAVPGFALLMWNTNDPHIRYAANRERLELAWAIRAAVEGLQREVQAGGEPSRIIIAR